MWLIRLRRDRFLWREGLGSFTRASRYHRGLAPPENVKYFFLPAQVGEIRTLIRIGTTRRVSVPGNRNKQVQRGNHSQIVPNVKHCTSGVIDKNRVRRDVCDGEEETKDGPEIAEMQGVGIYPLDRPIVLSLLLDPIKRIIRDRCSNVRGRAPNRSEQENDEDKPGNHHVRPCEALTAHYTARTWSNNTWSDKAGAYPRFALRKTHGGTGCARQSPINPHPIARQCVLS